MSVNKSVKISKQNQISLMNLGTAIMLGEVILSQIGEGFRLLM
jgi:hypothetical protein